MKKTRSGRLNIKSSGAKALNFKDRAAALKITRDVRWSVGLITFLIKWLKSGEKSTHASFYLPLPITISAVAT